MIQRLQKVLAHAGLASRRAAERMILEGRVTVNGAVVTRLGVRVDPERDAVKVAGTRRPAAPTSRTYLMVHKPAGYVTTLSDPEGRPTVRDLLPGVKTRVYPVGRLDFHSEGLLLLTDDGELAAVLMHPRSGIPKTYRIKVRGCPGAETLRRLSQGVVLDGRPARAVRVAIVRPGANAWLEVSVVEGRKHVVRRMLEALGHPVSKLRRVRYGELRLGRLPRGGVRPLTPGEVEALRRSAASSVPRRGARAASRDESA